MKWKHTKRKKEKRKVASPLKKKKKDQGVFEGWWPQDPRLKRKEKNNNCL